MFPWSAKKQTRYSSVEAFFASLFGALASWCMLLLLLAKFATDSKACKTIHQLTIEHCEKQLAWIHSQMISLAFQAGLLCILSQWSICILKPSSALAKLVSQFKRDRRRRFKVTADAYFARTKPIVACSPGEISIFIDFLQAVARSQSLLYMSLLGSFRRERIEWNVRS